MPQISNGLETTTISTRVTDPPLVLHITEKAFHPNPTTVRFSRCVRVAPGDIVFDIGTGVGPLAIMAAKSGAGHVYGVDPVPMHCELARMNVAEYGLSDTIDIYQGCFFEPFETEPDLRDVRADVIIGDVSGIATPVAHALGWYSDQVPTGGEDGTEVIIALLHKAAAFLKPDGVLYFPIAVDLSDSGKIVEVANQLFEDVENAMDRTYVTFPITEPELQAILHAYNGDPPDFITIQEGRRPTWRGQILKASTPR